ncbi:response regulator transcription factor [Bacillus altitudinis MN12]|jgi:NarL family two-component system response regulator YdfI|uniref:Two-component response regulator (YdfH) n=1 Tax=Bacillus altitudinis TaxID=293387 RepID=A0A653M4R4_BACAB|nr:MULTISPECIES: response regulator transcription factor [Bacillus]AMM87968.1 chemotaxis protein CheY [Bacillus pumilus]KML03758.1 chemotaxis protein CheY [Bacillus stratosphericus]MBX7000390.1 response regulator transcription factor [Bacillus aerophilus]ATH71189.1 response regulator transcription factor [Bacillus altitudinis]KAJ0072089.1 response regulator transcription factor [Bacillus altitudinis]
MSYQIVIVDDHFVVREGLKLILETDQRFDVVGEAEDGAKGLDILKEKAPDLVLLDLNMPNMSGLEMLKEMQSLQLKVPVLILTTYNEEKLMIEGLQLGAKGYLLKDASRENLFYTIEAAIRGDILLQANVAAKVFESTEHQVTPTHLKKEINMLTEKEMLVLQAVARGYRSKEIAFDMGISERTVKAHLTNIYQKLEVTSRAEAIKAAVELGVIHF